MCKPLRSSLALLKRLNEGGLLPALLARPAGCPPTNTNAIVQSTASGNSMLDQKPMALLCLIPCFEAW